MRGMMNFHFLAKLYFEVLSFYPKEDSKILHN